MALADTFHIMSFRKVNYGMSVYIKSSIHINSSGECKYVNDRQNALWPSDAIWRPTSRSTLAHLMACCPTTPNYHPKQC